MTTASRARWTEQHYPDPPEGGTSMVAVKSIITFAPGIAAPLPPVYSDWSQIETVVSELQGNAILLIDQTGLPGFVPIPATANLNGFGRLEIHGVGPNGEAELLVADGGVLADVQMWRTIVVRASPTIQSPVHYTAAIDGLTIEMFDATFLFALPGGPVLPATKPIIQVDSPTYIGILMTTSSEFRNSHQPGKAVLNLGGPITLLLAVNTLDFPSSFNSTISGPAGSSIDMQLDASVEVPTLPAFLGALTTVFIDEALQVQYTPAVLANWSGVAPTSVANALDRIAAKVGPIP
jgi:hypothetical protein